MTDLFDPDAEFDARPTSALVELAYADHRPIGLRARAVTALGRRAPQPDAVAALVAVGQDEGMREARMFELISLAYLAVAGLVHAGAPETLAAARDVVEDLSPGDRTSLVAFLASGDLHFEPTAG